MARAIPSANLRISGLCPLDRVYGYEPIPKELPENKRQYVLGAQASVWTEYIATSDYLEYMLFPRLLALSEAVWSPAAGRTMLIFIIVSFTSWSAWISRTCTTGYRNLTPEGFLHHDERSCAN